MTAPRDEEDHAPLGMWWLPVLIVLGVYAVFFGEALTRYPSGYDGLNYHLPVAVRWMQTRAIDMTPGLPHQSMPENGSIAASLLAFAGWERLVTIVHAPEAVVAALALFVLARAIGLSRRGAVMTTCVAMSIPMVIFQSLSGYIDLFAMVAWLCALVALVYATRVQDQRARLGLLIMGGLAGGVALGSKTTFLVLVAMLVGFAAAIEWIKPAIAEASARRAARNALIFGLACLTCSAFWFVRATVRTGNPVYPLQLCIAGKEILPGVPVEEYHLPRPFEEKIRRWWNYPWRETKYTGTGYPCGVNNGLGAAYAAFVPLGVVAAGWTACRRRPRGPTEKLRLLFLVAALTGLALHFTVFVMMLRFTLPLNLLAVVVAGVFVDRMLHAFPRATVSIATIGLVVTAAVTTLKPVHSLMGRLKDGRWDRAWYYQIPEVIDELESGARIVNLALPNLNYPLLGGDYQNHVIYPPEWELMTGGTMSAGALLEHQIDYVFVREPWPEGWPEDLPVALIFDDTHGRALASTLPTRIYRVVRSEEHLADRLAVR
jgi:hypothetical protein